MEEAEKVTGGTAILKQLRPVDAKTGGKGEKLSPALSQNKTTKGGNGSYL